MGFADTNMDEVAQASGVAKGAIYHHFRSKEALQVEVLEHAAARFTDQVVRPALQKRRGVPRMRALFERWLAWEQAEVLPGGCVFVAAASELDDRPGPVRDALVTLQRQWVDVLARSFRYGIEERQFRADADPEQFAQDLYGIMLAYHHHARLLADPLAERRARRAFRRLLEDARR